MDSAQPDKRSPASTDVAEPALYWSEFIVKHPTLPCFVRRIPNSAYPHSTQSGPFHSSSAHPNSAHPSLAHPNSAHPSLAHPNSANTSPSHPSSAYLIPTHSSPAHPTAHPSPPHTSPIHIAQTSSNPDDLYVHSLRSAGRVIFEELRIGGGPHRLNPTGDYFSAAMELDGWFELLSQDGRAVRPLESVEKLARALPKRCLVRRGIVGVKPDGGVEARVVVERGSLLSVVETRVVAVGVGGTEQGRQEGYARKMLVCRDEHGVSVYFDMDQRGLFHPVAGANDITGVHDVKSILLKFRLPVTVRLVCGYLPTGCTGVFRLIRADREPICFGLPLGGDESVIVQLPGDDDVVKFIVAEPKIEVEGRESRAQLERRCARLITEHLNKLHHISPGVVHNRPKFAKLSTTFGNELMTSSDVQAGKTLSPSDEDEIFKEIEAIYMRVRGTAYIPRVPVRNAAQAAPRTTREHFGVFQNAARPVSYAAHRANPSDNNGAGVKPVQASHSFTVKSVPRKESRGNEFQPTLTRAVSAFNVDVQASLRADRKAGYSAARSPSHEHIPVVQSQFILRKKTMENDNSDFIFHRESQLRKSAANASVEGVVQDGGRKKRLNASFSGRSARALANQLSEFSSSNQLKDFSLSNQHKEFSSSNQMKALSTMPRDAHHDDIYEEIKLLPISTNSLPSNVLKNSSEKELPQNLPSNEKATTKLNDQQMSMQYHATTMDKNNNSSDALEERQSAQKNVEANAARPKSYAGCTAWENTLVDGIEIGEAAPPRVPPKRVDSLKDFASHDTVVHSKTESRISAAAAAAGELRKKSKGSRTSAGSKMADAAGKLRIFSRTIAATCRRVTGRASQKLVVSDVTPPRGRSKTDDVTAGGVYCAEGALQAEPAMAVRITDTERSETAPNPSMMVY